MLRGQDYNTLVGLGKNNLYTEVFSEDLVNGTKDEFGAIYSSDGQRLLKGANIKEYSIRAGTKAICDSAFRGCKCLSSITIPYSIYLIGKKPFESCGELVINCQSPHFEVDNNVLYSKGKKELISFINVSNSSFYIPPTVNTIGEYAFCGCGSLTSIHIPSSVTFIGDGAFANCDSLTSIHIPASVTYVGDYVFQGCVCLADVELSSSISFIGYSSFWACHSLSSINIPTSVLSIDNGAFGYCLNLKSISIPKSVKEISSDAFMKCDNLSTIIIPKGSRAKFERMLPEDLHDKLIER